LTYLNSHPCLISKKLNTGKSYSKFPTTLSTRFPSYVGYNKTVTYQTVVHTHETKQIRVILCFPRACYKQQIKANCVILRWFNATVRVTIVLAMCESCSGRFIGRAVSAISTKGFQTVFNYLFLSC
jgi:predicted ABC-type ATPase